MREKLASLGHGHFFEAGSAMKPVPLVELFNRHPHNVILIPQTAPGSAAQPVA